MEGYLRQEGLLEENIPDGIVDSGWTGSIQKALMEALHTMGRTCLLYTSRLEKQVSFLETHAQYHWVGSNAELTDGQGVWGLQKMPEIPQKEDFLFNSPYIHPVSYTHLDVYKRQPR